LSSLRSIATTTITTRARRCCRSYERAAELMRTYADLEVGFVDCAVLAVTERLGEPKLATLDHRHFGTMRPRHVEAFELLPAAS